MFTILHLFIKHKYKWTITSLDTYSFKYTRAYKVTIKTHKIKKIKTKLLREYLFIYFDLLFFFLAECQSI